MMKTTQAVSTVQFRRRPVVVVMGVCGSGKSTIGAALALRLGLPFLDADDYHPPANVEKMSHGTPLTDEDRWPWLAALGLAMGAEATRAGGVVAACSALKRSYRHRLSAEVGMPMAYVLLDGDRGLLLRRLQARKGHYMPASLLDSQLGDLEQPTEDEPVLTLSIDQDVDALVEDAARALARLI